MSADIAAQQDSVARLNALWADREVVLDYAYAGGVDEDAVGMAPVYHFGIAGDDGDHNGRTG